MYHGVVTDPYGNLQSVGCLASEGNGKPSLSARTFIIRLAGVEIKALGANIGIIPTDPGKAKVVLRGGTLRYALPMLFVGILAYHNSVCVNS